MKAKSVSGTSSQATSSQAAAPPDNVGQSFAMSLEAAGLEYSDPKPGGAAPRESDVSPISSTPVLTDSGAVRTGFTPASNAAAAYQQQMRPPPEPPAQSSYEKYKDDQLLRNPGGRNYFLEKKEVAANGSRQSFLSRIGKDLSDGIGNIRNFAENIFLGSKFLYRDRNGTIQEGQRRGLLGTLINFAKDLGSALSFGAYHPDRENEPNGFKDRLFYTASKLKDAVWGDIVEGIPASVNHMGKNLMLAGWHLVEVLPDATIGNFNSGDKLTTTIFDNGHVMVEYLTDILPSGDAWFRVHASSLKPFHLPIVYNLNMPENFAGDTRWEYVRNTPFRKSIETIGTLLADGLALGLIGQTGFSGNRHRKPD